MPGRSVMGAVSENFSRRPNCDIKGIEIVDAVSRLRYSECPVFD